MGIWILSKLKRGEVMARRVNLRERYIDSKVEDEETKKVNIEHEVLVVEEGEEGNYNLNTKLTYDNTNDFKELNDVIVSKFGEGDKRIFFDQSTNTGYAIYEEDKLRIVGRLNIDKSSSVEAYKFELKTIVENYIDTIGIDEVWYEEVYDDKNKRTTEVLMYIKHLFKDISYEKMRREEYIGMYGVDHMVWKKIMSDGGIKKGTDHKKQVQEYVEKELKLSKDVSRHMNEDMFDSVGIGIARSIKLGENGHYMMARYYKRLPVHESYILEDDVDLVDKKLNKPFREARDLGILYYDKESYGNIKPNELARRVLTHRDCLVVIEVGKDYKEFGIMLLKHGIRPKQVKEDRILLTYARKRRL